MAEVKVVELQIKTNIDGASSSISKLTSGLKNAKTESKALNETMQGSKESEFINKLGDGVGKLNPAFGAAVKGANGLILKMWEMVANPVGAILAGIVVTAKFLYEAFQSSVAGGKELKTIFAAISSVGEQVKDAMFGLGRALINVTSAAYKFITLDFKGAAADMKKANKEAAESYEQLGNAVDGTTFKIIKNLEKQQQANDKARKIQAVVQSETNKLLVQSREILTDETASIKDKKKALEEVTVAEKASSAEKVRVAKVDLDILKAKAQALGGESEKKMKQAIRDATIALNEAETENAMTGIKLNKQRKMLNRQEIADVKEKNDAIIAANKEATEKRASELKEALNQRKEYLDKYKAISDENDLYVTDIAKLKRDKEKADMIADLQSKVANGNQWVEEHKRMAVDEVEIQKRKDEAIAASRQNLNNIISSLESSGLAKTKAGQVISKAIALTQIGIDSAVAISKASTLANAEGVAAQLAFPMVPGAGTIARVVSYASTAASVIGNIARAKQLLSGGGAMSGGTAGSTVGGGITPSAPQFNVVGASSTNQLAQTIGKQQNQPLKAYVVSNEVTTQQSLDRNIVTTATL